jgi:hypothetical protein
MEYITTANVLAWVFLTLGFFLMFVGYWLAATALFPRHVECCEANFARPVVVCLIGLLLSVVPIGAGFAILKVFPAALKWIGLFLVAAPILCGLIGSAGLAKRIGSGLRSKVDEGQAWRGVLRGGVVLSLTLLLPVLGQLLLMPLMISAGLGASVLAWFKKAPASPPPVPEFPPVQP